MPRRSVLAVDIGATKTLLAVRSMDELDVGWQPAREVLRVDTPADPGDLVSWIARAVERLGANGRLAAVGIAAPGPVDAATGVVTRSSNLGWSDVPLAAMLGERFGIPAALDDDANTAALGEWSFGAGGGADPFAYLTVSSGIGGGIIVGGQVVRGATGNAGEVGHIVINPAGPACSCGRRGDVESYAGGVSLARRARLAWPAPELPDGRPAPRTAADVFRAARGGEATAAAIVAEADAALAAAFAALASVIEPSVIVVGGSIGLGQRRFVRRAVRLARRRVMAENGRSLRVEPAALGEESVLAGAASFALRLLPTR
ncbi:MAG TPA: ROK family protein [Anaerolineae bacterium]|nr:ROK family protein [Anaerolineae bacterium]